MKKTVNRKWNFVYDETLSPDSYGANEAGIISDGEHFLFYHAVREKEDDPVETCYIFSSLCDMYEFANEVCSYPWTSENDEILLNALNTLDNPDDFCGAGSPIEVLKFKPYEDCE